MRQRIKIVAHSRAPNGTEIITYEMHLWRSLLAELNTHKAISRSAASSRAVPAHKRRKQVANDPWMPSEWGSNQKGMMAGGEIKYPRLADLVWKSAAKCMVLHSWALDKLDVHKSLPNRLLECFHTVPVVFTATTGLGLQNFFALRCERDENGNPLAERHFAEMADEMLRLYQASTPRQLEMGQWHLPYVTAPEWEQIDWGNLDQVLLGQVRSVACCGRVSYENHDGTSRSHAKDRERYSAFKKDGHVSPFEHQATPAEEATYRSGNLEGWKQLRKYLSNECRSFDLHKRYPWLYPNDWAEVVVLPWP